MADGTYHHQDLKMELIWKGLELLNDVGYDKFSLRKVASLCKVSHNAPYRHFRDKEELIRAIMAQAVRDFGGALTAAVQRHPGDPLEQLRDLGKSYIGFFMEKSDYLKLFFASDLKETVCLKDGRLFYDGAFLFGVLVQCLKDYYRSIGDESKLDPLLPIEYWSSIHGLTTLLAGKKLSFDDWGRTVDQIMDRLISRVIV